MLIKNEKEIVRDAFGLWVSGLFGAVCGWNKNASFVEKRELFFLILERLLREGKVMFIFPGADCYISPSNPNPKLTVDDVEAQWQAPVSEIMDFLRSRWPDSVDDENDEKLTYYFYELPGLIWVGEDGRLVAS